MILPYCSHIVYEPECKKFEQGRTDLLEDAIQVFRSRINRQRLYNMMSESRSYTERA